jgi:hypothetical protein
MLHLVSRSGRALALLLSLMLLGPDGAAQGSDSCATAQPISGTGNFPFDNTLATTDGLPNGCEGQIEKDVWFSWTAAQDGTIAVETCELAVIDTVLAAYFGRSCPPTTPVAWNDDSCDLQSRIHIPVRAGLSFLLRVGVAGSQLGGPGTLSITFSSSVGCSVRTVGPDVIVGDLFSVQRWGSVGTTTGYSLGTVACNVGDFPMQWVAGTNQHPVIGQNAYRLENGRFEQIGMSWLKHGFTAIAQSLCCSCNPPGTGSLLGVGCSDPYSSSSNGDQRGLGPRSEVDPWTGAFSYPFGAQGQNGNAIYKRMQIENGDLDPALHPTARYFAEGHYVTPDDSAADNQMNNVSCRELQVGGFASGGWNLSLLGSTARRSPAILAWKAADPGVRIHSIQAPCDGQFLVGSLSSDNGNGTWHYEYAVYNMNSARSGQAFSIPLPPGASVSGVGFKGISHHSGEPYAGTDWTSQVLADRVEWSTETFATNADAHALRWGTLFNFRFDSDAVPSTSAATLTFFVPGSPDSMSTPAEGPGEDCTMQNYCITSPNSAGAGALIAGSGSTSIGANDFGLAVSACPTNQFGMFYYGSYAVQVPFGAGLRCVGGSIVRFGIQHVDNAGDAARAIDYGSLPPGGQIQAGDTWRFQFWYRDPMAGGTTFNLSDGLEARFCP